LKTLSAIRRMSTSESKCKAATAAPDLRLAAALIFFGNLLTVI
jgi:hypothetical protein